MSKKRGKRRAGAGRNLNPGQRRPARPAALVAVASPFAGLSPEERAGIAGAVAEEAGRRFDEDFAAVQRGLLAYEPLSLLAHLSFYALTAESDARRPPRGFPDVRQHHAELLQALALRHDRSAFAWMPSFPDLVPFLERLDRAALAFSLRRAAPQPTDEGQRRLWVQEQMRVHTQAVRNWGYPDQTWRIVAELFAPLDDDIEAAAGVRVGHLVAMLRNLLAEVGRRVRRHFERLRPVVEARTARAALDAHLRAYPDPVGTADDLEAVFAALGHSPSLAELKEFLLADLNLRLPEVYALGPGDFAAAYPAAVDPERLAAVVAAWSLSFGDLADGDPEHLFLGNPVWRRPFVRLEDGRSFLPVFGLLQSFCLELAESLVEGIPGLLGRYHDRRALYLEDEVERLFATAFPSARVYRGSLWSPPGDPATVYENDLLVALGSHLVVVEAKAGSVGDPTLRGSPDGLARAVRRLLAEPAEQAQRFAAFLREHPGPHRFATRRGAVNEVDARPARETVCLAVTLDQLGRVYSRWPGLREAGFVGPEAELVPTLSLVDLESVLEVLDGQCQRLHYLVRRGEFERNAAYAGSELDLLAFYLDTGFAVDTAKFDGTRLLLAGEALRLEPYLMRRTTGASPPRPRLRLTKWWRDVLARVEERHPDRWTELALVLLDVPRHEQERFERRFATTRRIVERYWRNPGHEDVVHMGSGPAGRRLAVAGLAVRAPAPWELEGVLAGVADRALEATGAERGAVLVVDVVRQVYPYRAIAYIEPAGTPEPGDTEPTQRVRT